TVPMVAPGPLSAKSGDVAASVADWIVNGAFPVFSMVTVFGGPVLPQLTSPFGSFGSVPNVTVAGTTTTGPLVRVPVSGSGEGGAADSLSVVVSVTFAG